MSPGQACALTLTLTTAQCIPQVVFLGLDILIPLMTSELLRFPKLARAYFALLAYMLEVYPERVAALPGTALLRIGVLAHSRPVAPPQREQPLKRFTDLRSVPKRIHIEHIKSPFVRGLT